MLPRRGRIGIVPREWRQLSNCLTPLPQPQPNTETFGYRQLARLHTHHEVSRAFYFTWQLPFPPFPRRQTFSSIFANICLTTARPLGRLRGEICAKGGHSFRAGPTTSNQQAGEEHTNSCSEYLHNKRRSVMLSDGTGCLSSPIKQTQQKKMATAA